MSSRGAIDMCLELLENAGGSEDLPIVQRCIEQLVVARQRGQTITGVRLEQERDERAHEASPSSPMRW